MLHHLGMLGFMGKINISLVTEFLWWWAKYILWYIIIYNIVYLIENVYLLMMQNWTMHYEEEGIKFVGYQKSLHEKKIGQEVENTNTLNFSTLLLRIFFDITECPLLKRFLLIQIPDYSVFWELENCPVFLLGLSF